MKKLVFLSMFISSIAISQVTDENGTEAIGPSSTTLSGNIGIGLTSPSLPQLMLAIGDIDSGIVGGANTLGFYTDNTSWLSIDNAGIINVANRLNVNHPNLSTYLLGAGITFRNHETVYGWSEPLIKIESNSGSKYWQLGTYGSAQSYNYGYIGNTYNDKAINWNASHQVGIGLAGDDQPSIMLAVGDSDTGLVGSNNMLDFYTGNNSRLSIDSDGAVNVAERLNVSHSHMSTYLLGDGITMRNHYTGTGWAKGLVRVENDLGSEYWELGAYGVGQSHDYGYLGINYNNKAINWLANNNVGIALPDTNQPSIMLAVGDSDTGLVGGTNTLDLYTGNTPKVTINEVGNVGVGTTTPTEKLEVDGNVKARKLISNSDNDPYLAQFGNQIASSNRRNFNIVKAQTNDELVFNMIDTDNTERVWITARHDIGWIGLKDSNGSEVFKVGRIEADELSFLHMPKPGSRIVLGDFGGYLLNEGHQLVVKEGSALIEGNILTNSKIGVGVSSADIPADYKMAVAGKIISEEVLIKLQSTWPDYVFNNDYNLPTLQEVEDHIKKEGHLINIPNAKDVEEKGIMLGEMNAKLLEKIEELTLYTIQQQKELEVQEEKNKHLEERLSKIELLLSKPEKE